jgi:TRAP-type C4-dicarboxylate transport system substrate-binding protein
MKAILLLALGLALAGCGARAQADKSGGDAAPVTLRMATMEADGAPYADGVREFARQVEDLSGGSLRIEVVWDGAEEYLGEFGPGADQKVAGLVQSGELDMGLIPARAWDRLGVTSLQALQAPFLVDNEALVGAVVTSDLARDMLAGLDAAGVVGLALLPEGLRYPVGFDGPLVALGDFAGATLRVFPSDASSRLFEALGASTVDVNGEDFDIAVRDGTIAGAESEFARGGELPHPGAFTANLSVYAKESAIVANEDVFERLSGDQRSILREAAARAQRFMIEHDPTEAQRAEVYCGVGGRIVVAPEHDVAAVHEAAKPVYAALEADPQTKSFIARLRAMKAEVAAQPLPDLCAPAPRESEAPAGASTPNGFPEGVYRRDVTAEYLMARGMDSITAHQIEGQTTLTIEDGRWSGRTTGIDGDCHGPYELEAGRIFLYHAEAQCGGPAGLLVMSARWRLDGDEFRFLDVRVGRPLEWGGMPWRKIG